MKRAPLGWEYWRQILSDQYGADEALLALADEIERRAAQGLDADPVETSDWLRGEVTG
jgi:hypothetical protein